MAEELRFFIRIALYIALATTVYWFVSYEAAGTVLLGALALTTTAFALVVGVMVRPKPVPTAREDGAGLVATLDRTVGFRERPGAAPVPLALADEPIPPSSAWPLAASIGLLLVGLGLLYGPWFWLPGAGLAAASAWGWTTQLTR